MRMGLCISVSIEIEAAASVEWQRVKVQNGLKAYVKED
jgi:hypothetical protein